ncbi:hypothetical protein, partial [Salmonella enterica]|uniref:hypothetical protein n=1 Tax=Salmonella enterica TaxID=28901 RepID=UPI003CEEB8A7
SKMVVDRMVPGKVAEVKVRGMNICRQIYTGRNARRPATGAQTAFWEFLNGVNPEKLTPSLALAVPV